MTLFVAYEPPKVAKEQATYIAYQVPSQSKSIANWFLLYLAIFKPYKDCVCKLTNDDSV